MQVPITIDSLGCCTCKHCVYSHLCSQHNTAGGERTLHGFRPSLVAKNGEYLCNTAAEPRLNDMPTNIHGFGGWTLSEINQLSSMKRNYKEYQIGETKNIALVAHDGKKHELMEWAAFNKGTLQEHKLFATGTTGKKLEEILGVAITKFNSGPLGGDQQIGAKIVENVIDFLVFFWDPLAQQPHDPDVKALLRLAAMWNIPVACDRSTADFLISSPLMKVPYTRLVPDYDDLRNRKI